MKHMNSSIGVKIRGISLLIIILCSVFTITHAQDYPHRYKGTLILTKTNPTVEGHDEYIAPGSQFQSYTVYNIDLTNFAGGGTLIINLSTGDGCPGSFDIFPAGFPLPTEGRPEGTLAGDYDVGGKGEIIYEFKSGQVFQFGATGSWFAEKGATNTYTFKIKIDFKYEGKDAGTIALTPGHPEGTFSGSFIAPGIHFQAYTITQIDLKAFTKGGILKFTIKLGNGESTGSFDLFPAGVPIPTEGRPEGTVAGAYDVGPNSEAGFEYEFTGGSVFNFGATGGWFSEKGSKNDYTVVVKVLKKK